MEAWREDYERIYHNLSPVEFTYQQTTLKLTITPKLVSHAGCLLRRHLACDIDLFNSPAVGSPSVGRSTLLLLAQAVFSSPWVKFFPSYHHVFLK